MINYSCDLCGGKCNEKEFVLPVAATHIGLEPCDLMPINMNLCKECRSKIYKLIETIVSEDRIKKFNELALDKKMNR